MKKFNLFIAVLTLLFLAVLGSYIYFLDNFNKTKQLQSEITSLKEIKQNIDKPIVIKADDKLLIQKSQEYTEVLKKLELKAQVDKEEKIIQLSGAIHDTYDYMMVKRILNILKNDQVKIEQLCLGVGCNENEYGFFINFTPYELTYQ